MPSSYTSSLRLTLPATGELAGQWGSVVNQGITELLDAAVAGTTVISTWGGAGVPYTLSNNSGTADEARKMFLVATGTPGEAKNVICPAVSKLYVFRNDTTGGFALTLKTSGGTGIAVPAGQYKMLYCDGTNVVEAVNSAGALTLSGALSVGGTTTLASNPTLSAGTANGVAYANASKVLTTGSALTFDGTALGATRAIFTAADNAYATAFNATTGNLRITPYESSTYSSTALVAYSAGYAGYGPLTVDALNHRWWVSGSEQMRLTSTGLGIGTSSPGEKLNVIGGDSTTSTVNFTGANGVDNATIASDYSLIFQVDANNNVGGRDFNWRYGGKGYSDGTSLMVLNSSGNLGLGVTPSAWAPPAAGYSVMQIRNAAFYGISTNIARMSVNAFVDGSGVNTYINNGFATRHDQQDGEFRWLTAPSGTAGNAISFGDPKMTLTADGDLGLGVTSVSSGISGSAKTLGICDAETTNLASVRLSSGTSFASGSRMEIYAAAGQVGLQGETNVPMVFATNNTERARITSGGYFKASNSGTYASSTSTTFEFYKDTNDGNEIMLITAAQATAANQYGVGIRLAGDPNNASAYFMQGRGNATERFTLRSNGGLANYSANDVNLSDRREKTNFAPAKSYLDTICAIPVQTFEYIDQNPDDPGLTLGVVAQDVQAVAPELVMESNWGTEDNPKMRLSIYQTDLQYALMKCIQELKAQNDELRARVAALEAQP